jgi:hypothetical protein
MIAEIKQILSTINTPSSSLSTASRASSVDFASTLPTHRKDGDGIQVHEGTPHHLNNSKGNQENISSEGETNRYNKPPIWSDPTGRLVCVFHREREIPPDFRETKRESHRHPSHSPPMRLARHLWCSLAIQSCH